MFHARRLGRFRFGHFKKCLRLGRSRFIPDLALKTCRSRFFRSVDLNLTFSLADGTFHAARLEVLRFFECTHQCLGPSDTLCALASISQSNSKQLEFETSCA